MKFNIRICALASVLITGLAACSVEAPQTEMKPQPETEGKKGFVCKVCGWVYEGEELPADIICPLCKHGAADFEAI